jgi:hypothetical protein
MLPLRSTGGGAGRVHALMLRARFTTLDDAFAAAGRA